jgi:two-component system response regulator PilR (NtrC family)
MTQSKRPHILIVDDEPDLLELLELTLLKMGLDVTRAPVTAARSS